jgi:formylmethanofuran dehydrogenase subunit E
MDKEGLRRLIREGRVDRIGERVEVEFDNRQQSPLGFRYRGRHYEVLELIWAERASPLQYHYLVRTGDGIYNVVLVRQDAVPGISPSTWWLDYRVRDDAAGDEGADVPRRPAAPASCDLLGRPGREAGALGPGLALVRGDLLGAVAFHGHLCPELAIGYRAALIARARLDFGRHAQGPQSVLVHAPSSAADAIQYLTGCTVGKGNLVLEDHGCHAFCFENQRGRLLLKVLPGVLDKAPDVREIEEEAERGPVSRERLARYQAEVDRLVRRILEAPDEALFAEVLLTR